MSTWPDGTPKSKGNAFDWRRDGDSLMNDKAIKKAHRSSMVNAGSGANKKKAFTIYSKARKKA